LERDKINNHKKIDPFSIQIKALRRFYLGDFSFLRSNLRKAHRWKLCWVLRDGKRLPSRAGSAPAVIDFRVLISKARLVMAAATKTRQAVSVHVQTRHEILTGVTAK
jgi:hypothetical protein